MFFGYSVIKVDTHNRKIHDKRHTVSSNLCTPLYKMRNYSPMVTAPAFLIWNRALGCLSLGHIKCGRILSLYP